jgi:hypothetical protein
MDERHLIGISLYAPFSSLPFNLPWLNMSRMPPPGTQYGVMTLREAKKIDEFLLEMYDMHIDKILDMAKITKKTIERIRLHKLIEELDNE